MQLQFLYSKNYFVFFEKKFGVIKITLIFVENKKLLLVPIALFSLFYLPIIFFCIMKNNQNVVKQTYLRLVSSRLVLLRNTFLLLCIMTTFITQRTAAQTPPSLECNFPYGYFTPDPNWIPQNGVESLLNPDCGIFIRLYVHLVYDNTGLHPGLTLAEANEAVEVLNHDFAPTGIFFVWDGTPIYHNEPVLKYDIVFNANNHNGINMYLYDDDGYYYNGLPDGGGSAGSVGGTNAFIAWGKNFTGNYKSIFRTGVLAHEMGHVLNLLHTHDAYYGLEYVNRTLSNANGLLCKQQGDLLCDTEADPNLSFDVDINTCIWNQAGTQTDVLGITYVPNTHNLMSYSERECLTTFTQGQVQRMKDYINYVNNLGYPGGPIGYLWNTCFLNTPPTTTISTNTTWHGDRNSGSILIKSGATLTISGAWQGGFPQGLPTAFVRFAQDSKITVERGATLIVDGAVLTNLVYGPCSWKGIDVLGTNIGTNIGNLTTATQYTPGAQGKVILMNGAAIQQAEDGIEVGDANDGTLSGGIVYATDAYFLNNRRDVVFYRFQNHSIAYNHNIECDNVSYFKNCYFGVSDLDYTSSAGAYHFADVLERVSLYNVSGIRFEGCGFEGGASGLPYTAPAGIKSFDAGFSVLPYCTQGNVPIGNPPCPQNNLILSSFKKFYEGIYAGNTGSWHSFRVENTDFENNKKRDIFATQVNDIRIINNRFSLENNATSYTNTGVLLLGCSRYHIEENLFTRNSSTGNVAGIGVVASGTDENEIYKNTFQSLTYGNASVWTNRDVGGNSAAGLQYLCNTHINNDYDIAVTDGEGIRYYQGSPEPIQTESTPDGNTFSINALIEGNYFNISNNQVLRFYDPNIANTEALEFSNGWVIQVDVTGINTCLSHINKEDPKIPSQERMSVITEYNSHKNEYEVLQYLYANLIDGGSTQAVLTDISTEWAEDAWLLRNELVALSPNVSREALLEAANSGILPDALLYEVLMANRASCRDREFITKLSNDIPNPLPQYMIEWLVNAPEIASIRKEIEGQLATHSAQFSQNVGIIISDLLADSTVNKNSLAYWIGQLNTPHAQYSLIDVLIQKGEYSAAQSMLNAMPTTFAYIARHQTEHQAFSDFADLKIALAQEDRTWKELSNTELAEVQRIAALAGTGAIQAQAVLCFFYGDCPDIDINITPPANLRHQNVATQVPVFSTCSAYPNPAKEFVVFEYNLPFGSTNSYIEIADITGKVIHQVSLSSNEKQVIWDTQAVPAGIYLYSLWIGGERSTTHKITIQK